MDNSDSDPSQSNVYEMLWDCKFCGTKKLLGKTHRFCPNCGGQQDASWRYFPSDDEKVEVKGHVFVGADLVCHACHALNGPKCEYCGTCGAPLSDAAKANEIAARTKNEGERFNTEDLQKRRAAESSAPPQQLVTTTTGLTKFKWIALGVVALMMLVIFAFTRTETINVATTGFKWERSIGMEMMQAVSGRAECGNQPGDAYNISQHYEQVGTRQVPDGQTCQTRQVDQGDGTFREQQDCSTRYRSEPVMGYMCSYVVNRWAAISPIVAAGDKSSDPYWPNTNLGQSAACSMLGCKRETQRREKYLLLLRSEKNRDYECAVAPEQWNRTDAGSHFSIKMNSLFKNAKCDTLKPQ